MDISLLRIRVKIADILASADGLCWALAVAKIVTAKHKHTKYRISVLPNSSVAMLPIWLKSDLVRIFIKIMVSPVCMHAVVFAL